MEIVQIVVPRDMTRCFLPPNSHTPLFLVVIIFSTAAFRVQSPNRCNDNVIKMHACSRILIAQDDCRLSAYRQGFSINALTNERLGLLWD